MKIASFGNATAKAITDAGQSLECLLLARKPFHVTALEMYIKNITRTGGRSKIRFIINKNRFSGIFITGNLIYLFLMQLSGLFGNNMTQIIRTVNL
jgi:hypothetical protein